MQQEQVYVNSKAVARRYATFVGTTIFKPTSEGVAMERSQLLRTYDGTYADTYDLRWIESRPAKNKFEVDLVRAELTTAQSWLDVACGTGWMLSRMDQYAGVRAGVDLSPAMVRLARSRCPGARIYAGDATQRDAVGGEWGLVTSFWGAYGLQPTMSDAIRFVENLVLWLAPGRRGLLTVVSPQRMSNRTPIGVVPNNDSVTDWSLIEGSNETHSNVYSPSCATLQATVENVGGVCEWLEYPREDPSYPPSVLRMLRFTRAIGTAEANCGE